MSNAIARRALIVLLTTALGAACAAVDSGQSVPVVDRAALLDDLRILSADDMQGRLAGTPGAARARAHVVDRFRASGLEPFGASFEQPFTFAAGRDGERGTREGVNVVGLVRGRETPDRYIAITAHYDHVGTQNGDVYNGADDNASGTAALFAIASHFSRNRPAASLILAALDAEEGGLRGARAFVDASPVPLDAVVLNLNLDMIGRDADDVLYAVGTHHYPYLAPYIEQVGARASITLRTGHDEPARPGVDDWTRDSDHFVFHERGIPFIYFGVEDYAHHHKATDDYETMTHDFYVRAVETIIEATRVVSDNLAAIASERTRR